MNATELVCMVRTWFDALTVAELMESPFLRIGKDWDFRGWTVEEVPEGLIFRHVAANGDKASVLVFQPDNAGEFTPAHVLVVDGDLPVSCVCRVAEFQTV